MALTDITISFDLAQLLGSDFDPRRTKAYVTTNVESGTLMDTSTGETRLGDEPVTIAADGTGSFTTWAIGADGNPISWQTSLVVDYPRTGQRDRKRRTFGPWTLTTTDDGKNITALEDEQAIPAEYQTAFTASMETIRDDSAANLAQQELVAGLTGEDDAVALLVNTPTSDTAVALSAAIADRALGTTTDQIVYLSKSAKASDSNDGLSWGRPKATLQGAYDALPSTGGRIEASVGTWTLPTGAIGFNILPTKPLHLRGGGNHLTEFTYSGSGVGLQVGTGRTITDLATTISSTTVTSATAAFTAADVGRTIYAPDGSLNADVTITAVTNSTTVTLSSAAIATGTGQTAHITTPSMNWGSLKDFQLTTTNFTSQTGVKMYDAHGGDVEIRTLGNSYSVGSRGIHAINCFTNYIRRAVVQNYETGIDLDGGNHDTSIDNTNIGAKVACVRVKNSTDFRGRGGQWSTTGAANNGIGLMVVCTAAASSDGGCEGLQTDNIHFESNGYGLDVVLGRVEDGSTKSIRSPKIDGKILAGATFDRVSGAVVDRLTIGFNGVFTVRSNCTDLRLLGAISNNGTITDSGVRTLRDSDAPRIWNGQSLPLDLTMFPATYGPGAFDTLTQDSGSWGGGYRTQSSVPAVNDSCVWNIYLPANGTYAADVFFTAGPDGGDFSLSLYGTVVASTNQGYAAANTARMVTMQPLDIDDTLIGRTNAVRLTVTGKNASSTGYRLRVSKIIFRRTA